MLNTQQYLERDGSAEVNIAPLIDMVFILLIFFIVTTSFVQETGIQVDKPTAASAEQLEATSILVGLRADGRVYMNGREIGLLSVRAQVREQLRSRELPVVIVADRNARTQALLDVIDECKQAGAKRISLASEKE